MKKTDKTANGTSFHDVTITATLQQLITILGEPTSDNNTGDNKVNIEWVCENNDGILVTIYDWKENRPINNNENIKWHIGGNGIKDTLTAKLEILRLLNDTKNN